VNKITRDYSLLGASAVEAEEKGLAAAQWYHSDIPREDMRRLMQRKDGPAIRDTILYFAVLFASATGGIMLWGSWWSAPFWVIYATFYTAGADSRWHEAGHRTAFLTPWMNAVVYHIACFMLFRNPVLWRWSHSRHHTDTIIVGRDPEIITMRPPQIFKVLWLFIGSHTWDGFKATFRHALYGLNKEERSFTPDRYWKKAQVIAQIWLAICAVVLALVPITGSILPLMLVGVGPALLGSWHLIMTGLLQHTGMADNVLDHRLNSRSVYMNPISRFIYWNMNYHVEHHMFPMVPYHNLPALHEVIKHDLPPANRGFVDGLREVAHALKMQLSEPEYRIEKTLPPTAKPYQAHLHDLEV